LGRTTVKRRAASQPPDDTEPCQFPPTNKAVLLEYLAPRGFIEPGLRYEGGPSGARFCNKPHVSACFVSERDETQRQDERNFCPPSFPRRCRGNKSRQVRCGADGRGIADVTPPYGIAIPDLKGRCGLPVAGRVCGPAANNQGRTHSPRNAFLAPASLRGTQLSAKGNCELRTAPMYASPVANLPFLQNDKHRPCRGWMGTAALGIAQISKPPAGPARSFSSERTGQR